MKILFANTIFPEGHKLIDSRYIYALSKIGEVTVVAPKKWYMELPESVKIIEYAACHEETLGKEAKGRKAFYGASMRHICHIKSVLSSEQYDYVVVGAFDLVTFPGALLWNKRAKIIVMHHNNIDQLENSWIKRLIFNIYKKKVVHVVLEKYIKEYLCKQYNLEDNNVYVWLHPVWEKELTKEKEYDCVGISNSNDEELVYKIIEKEKINEDVKKSGLKIILRSRSSSFDNGYLKVITGWLDRKTYEDYISKAKVVYVPFSKSFHYRVSGSIIDAFSNGIPIVGTNCPLVDYYSEQYHSICETYCESTFLEAILRLSQCSEEQKCEFKKFQSERSILAIIEMIKGDLE